MKKSFLVVFLLLLGFSGLSQEKEKPLWRKLLGKPPETSITFLPIGSHTQDFDILDVWYTSFNYKSFEIAAFKNSYDILTVAFICKREIELTDKFSLIYGLGVMEEDFNTYLVYRLEIPFCLMEI
jgi:hypothetical protein